MNTVSKADVLETYADLYDVFEDNKAICKELDKIYDRLNTLPSAQKKGEWIRMDDEQCYWYECSVCGHLPPKDTFKQEWLSGFCPNCGARMRGADDDNM